MIVPGGRVFGRWLGSEGMKGGVFMNGTIKQTPEITCGFLYVRL